MKNTIQALAVIAIVAASIGNAAAQTTNYFKPRQGLIGYSQTHGNTTNYFVPGHGLIGYSIRN